MQNLRLVIECQYFPCVAWMCAGMKHGAIYLDHAENYNKRSLRNKTWLHQSEQPLVISIPLKKGKHNKKGIKSIEISNEENWQLNHIRAIQSVFGKSPYFIHYFDDIVELINSDEQFLLSFNKNILLKVIDLLKLELELNVQSEFIKSSADQFVVLRDQFKYTGEMSMIEKDYAEKINCIAGETHLNFQLSPRSSILDLLFYLGPETRLFLNRLNDD